MSARLQGGDEAVSAEGENAGSDPDPPAVFADALPHQPGATDLGEGSKEE